MSDPRGDAAGSSPISFGEAFRVWLKIGLLSFGGPVGQIALMHRVLVDEKRWLGEARFLHALNYCMLLPGPEAMQLMTYVGWLTHGTAGGIVAGLLFVLPGALVMLGLSVVYVLWHDTSLLAGVFFGIKAAVLAIVVQAVLRIGRRALGHASLRAIAAAAFVAIFLFAVPFPLIVAGAALAGLLGARRFPGAFVTRGHGEPAVLDVARDAAPPSTARTLATALAWLLAWWLPIGALAAWLGGSHVLVEAGLFFSKLAVVTFGGAYAVLAYMAQAAVETHGWLTAPQMLDGLGLAETTPGPLILVTQFVGFLAAHGAAGEWPPLAAGIAGAAVALWATFAPCFLWIFVGAPYMERLRENRWLGAALAAITAAVVGVILNIAVWFALHVLFARVDEHWSGPLRLLLPDLATLDAWALLLTAASLLATLRFRVGMVTTFAACAVAGVVIGQLS